MRSVNRARRYRDAFILSALCVVLPAPAFRSSTDPQTERLKAGLLKAARPIVVSAREQCARRKDTVRQVPGVPGFVRKGKDRLLPPEVQIKKADKSETYTGTLRVTVERARPPQPHYDTKEEAEKAALSVIEHRTFTYNFTYDGRKWVLKKRQIPSFG